MTTSNGDGCGDESRASGQQESGGGALVVTAAEMVAAALIDQLRGLEELSVVEGWPTIRMSHKTLLRWIEMLERLCPAAAATTPTPCGAGVSTRAERVMEGEG